MNSNDNTYINTIQVENENDVIRKIKENYEKGEKFNKFSENIYIFLNNQSEKDNSSFSSQTKKFTNNLYSELSNKEIQSIIIFGEANVGKTEITLECLNNFIINSQNSEDEVIEPEYENKIGNCYKIIRQFVEDKDKASKCNLLISLIFTPKGKINACKFSYNTMIPFSKENIFKIFYLILNSNLSQEEKEKYCLNDGNKYFSYLINNDKLDMNLKDFIDILTSINVSNEDIDNILSLLVSVLHLINVKFVLNDKNELLVSPDTQNNYSAFLSLIQNKTFNFFSFVSTIPQFFQNKTENAEYATQLIARQIYTKIFDFVLKKINSYFSSSFFPNKKTIYIYDTMGYCFTPFRDFYSMISHYSIEKIISLYTNMNIATEQSDYKSEDLKWAMIPYTDNSDIIHLFENKGIFDIIDLDENQRDKAIYVSIYEKLSQNLALGIKGDNFITINHSFGDVYYDIEGIMRKNYRRIININNTNKILVNISNVNSTSFIKHNKKLIDELVSVLSHSFPIFVKCISNEEMNDLSTKISVSNIYEILKLKKKCYTKRVPNTVFIYKTISSISKAKDIAIYNKEAFNSSTDVIKIRQFAIDVLNIINENKYYKEIFILSNIQIGISKVFMNDYSYKAFEKMCFEAPYIKLIQRNYLLHYNNIKNKREISKIEYCSTEPTFPARYRKKSQVLSILNKSVQNPIESELLEMIKKLQAEIANLKKENAQLVEENAGLKKKGRISHIIKVTDVEGKEGHDDLVKEIARLKSMIMKKDAEIETMKVNIEENESKISDLDKMNHTLREQIDKKNKSDLNQVKNLMERIQEVEKENYELKNLNNKSFSNKDIESGMKSNSNDVSNKNVVSDYKKNLFHLKIQLKHQKKSYDELKGKYDNLQLLLQKKENVIQEDENEDNDDDDHTIEVISQLKNENEQLKNEISQLKLMNSNNVVPERNSSSVLIDLNKKIFLLEEKLSKTSKEVLELNDAVQKKKFLIKTKKKENKILVEMFKNKKTEIQCIDALKYANSSNIKEKLIQIQNKEHALISQIDKIANTPYYTDDSDNDEDDNEEEKDNYSHKSSSDNDNDDSIEYSKNEVSD